VFYSNFVPKKYSTCPVTLKPRLGSLKVIGTNTYQSGTHDFLFTFHSNHAPISHRFRDKRRFQSKIANFSHNRVFNATVEWVPRKRSKTRTRMMGYQMVQ